MHRLSSSAGSNWWPHHTTTNTYNILQIEVVTLRMTGHESVNLSRSNWFDALLVCSFSMYNVVVHSFAPLRFSFIRSFVLISSPYWKSCPWAARPNCCCSVSINGQGPSQTIFFCLLIHSMIQIDTRHTDLLCAHVQHMKWWTWWMNEFTIHTNIHTDQNYWACYLANASFLSPYNVRR